MSLSTSRVLSHVLSKQAFSNHILDRTALTLLFIPAEGSAIVRFDTGVRSPHYGDIQRHHQEWLTRKAQQLSLRLRNSDRGADALTRSGHPDDGSGAAGEGGASLLEGRSKPVGGGGRGPEVERKTQDAGGERRSLTLYFRGAARAKDATAAASQVEVEDRIERVNTGARLWGETYVPPIEPARRQELIDKWTGKTWSPPENARQVCVCVCARARARARGKPPGVTLAFIGDVTRHPFLLEVFSRARIGCTRAVILRFRCRASIITRRLFVRVAGFPSARGDTTVHFMRVWDVGLLFPPAMQGPNAKSDTTTAASRLSCRPLDGRRARRACRCSVRYTATHIGTENEV